MVFAPMLLMAATPVLISHPAAARYQAPPPQRVLVYEVTLASTIEETNTNVGIADSNLYGLSEADINRSLDEMKAMGVTDVRILIPWAYMEPWPGFYDWSKVDMIVNAANARDMGVLGVLTSTPWWGGNPFIVNSAPNPDQYAAFAGIVADRYDGQITAYQIWNEQNTFAGYVGPTGGPDAAGYTQLLKQAYSAIKAADPDATVVAGGLVSVFSFGNLTTDPVTFVQQMYANGAQGYFDALAFHPYQYTMKFSEGAPFDIAAINQLEQIHQLMIANGDGDKLIWTTEYGEPSGPTPFTEQMQADYIADFLNTWKTLSYAGPAFLYTTRDNNSESTDPNDRLGLFETDWTPKQVVQVIKDWIAANHPTQPPPQPDPNAALEAMNQAFWKAIADALNAWFASLANAFAAPATQPAAPATEQAAALTTLSEPVATTSDTLDPEAENQQKDATGTDAVTAKPDSDTPALTADSAKAGAVNPASTPAAGTLGSSTPPSLPTIGEEKTAANPTATTPGGAGNTTRTENTGNGQSSTQEKSGSQKTGDGQSSAPDKGKRSGGQGHESKDPAASNSDSTQAGTPADTKKPLVRQGQGSDGSTG